MRRRDFRSSLRSPPQRENSYRPVVCWRACDLILANFKLLRKTQPHPVVQTPFHKRAVVRLLRDRIDALNPIQTCAYINNAVERMTNARRTRTQKYGMLEDTIAQVTAS